MKTFVAYYRVSTDKQGKSGLGLAAQRQAVAAFVIGRGEIEAEFTEIESSRKDRPQLDLALRLCQRRKGTLVIARLDRLARNVAFISNLMESRVDFVAVDMPEANRLTIHILAAVAEHERDMISKRTKEALAAAKVRGVKLGNPTPKAASTKGLESITAKKIAFEETHFPIIQQLRSQGISLTAIAKELNDRHIPTARGGSWHAATVGRIIKNRTHKLETNSLFGSDLVTSE